MKKILWICLLCCLCTSAFSIEKIFYLTNDILNSGYLSKKKLNLIAQRADKIDIIAPQIYELNARGNIWGNIDHELIALAKSKKLRIMPLLINAGFSQQTMHDLLHDAAAQQKVIDEMVRLAQEFDFYGWQFDFENINAADKNAYTEFVRKTASVLHQNKLIMSIAVVPHTDEQLTTEYDKWIFENWSGVFDYKQLGKIADSITLMSYDNHTSLTTPGPIAPLYWVEKTLQQILKVVPAQKISLGIPTYSGYWTTGIMRAPNVPEKYNFRAKETQISFVNAQGLIHKFKGKLIWDKKWQSSYALLENDDKIDYIFLEDAASFRAKFKLVKKYHLRGFSIWKLNLEDPAVWRLL